MRIKNVWIVSIGLTLIAAIGMVVGEVTITAVAVGALAGWLGAEKNGQYRDGIPPPQPC